jgi:Prophage protein (DUF1660)
MKYLLCLLSGHDLEPLETLSRYTQKMECRRCKREYAQTITPDEYRLKRWTPGMEESLTIRRRSLLAWCKGAR